MPCQAGRVLFLCLFKRRRTGMTDPETELYLSLSESFHFCLRALLNHQHTFNKIASHQNLFHHPRPHRRARRQNTTTHARARARTQTPASLRSIDYVERADGNVWRLPGGRGQISQSLRRCSAKALGVKINK